jgi:hypothetical protein
MKKFKKCVKERADLFILSKEMKTVLTIGDINFTVLDAIIELRIIRNKLAHLISKLEQQDCDFSECKNFKR